MYTKSQVVVGGLLGVGLITYLFMRGANLAADAREVVASYCVAMPSYEQNGEYIETLIDTHHMQCFQRHYDAGGRRRGASFDERAYFSEIFWAMGDEATVDGRAQIAQELIDAQFEIMWKITLSE